MKERTVKVVHDHGPFGGAYFVTMVGAAVYFVQQSEGFGEFIVALLKAMVWPGFVVHKVLGLLGL
jgi:hypothetical protein